MASVNGATVDVGELGSLPGGVPLAIAAKRLGVSIDAVRHRVKRGTLRAFKQSDRWYVLLPDQAATVAGDQVAGQHIDQGAGDQAATMRELVDQLRSEVAFLRGELSRKDQYLAAFAQLGPALTHRPADTGQPRRSWWRRLPWSVVEVPAFPGSLQRAWGAFLADQDLKKAH